MEGAIKNKRPQEGKANKRRNKKERRDKRPRHVTAQHTEETAGKDDKHETSMDTTEQSSDRLDTEGQLTGRTGNTEMSDTCAERDSSRDIHEIAKEERHRDSQERDTDTKESNDETANDMSDILNSKETVTEERENVSDESEAWETASEEGTAFQEEREALGGKRDTFWDRQETDSERSDIDMEETGDIDTLSELSETPTEEIKKESASVVAEGKNTETISEEKETVGEETKYEHKGTVSTETDTDMKETVTEETETTYNDPVNIDMDTNDTVSDEAESDTNETVGDEAESDTNETVGEETTYNYKGTVSTETENITKETVSEEIDSKYKETVSTEIKTDTKETVNEETAPNTNVAINEEKETEYKETANKAVESNPKESTGQEFDTKETVSEEIEPQYKETVQAEIDPENNENVIEESAFDKETVCEERRLENKEIMKVSGQNETELENKNETGETGKVVRDRPTEELLESVGEDKETTSGDIETSSKKTDTDSREATLESMETAIHQREITCNKKERDFEDAATQGIETDLEGERAGGEVAVRVDLDKADNDQWERDIRDSTMRESDSFRQMREPPNDIRVVDTEDVSEIGRETDDQDQVSEKVGTNVPYREISETHREQYETFTEMKETVTKKCETDSDTGNLEETDNKESVADSDTCNTEEKVTKKSETDWETGNMEETVTKQIERDTEMGDMEETVTKQSERDTEMGDMKETVTKESKRDTEMWDMEETVTKESKRDTEMGNMEETVTKESKRDVETGNMREISSNQNTFGVSETIKTQSETQTETASIRIERIHEKMENEEVSIVYEQQENDGKEKVMKDNGGLYGDIKETVSQTTWMEMRQATDETDGQEKEDRNEGPREENEASDKIEDTSEEMEKDWGSSGDITAEEDYFGEGHPFSTSVVNEDLGDLWNSASSIQNVIPSEMDLGHESRVLGKYLHGPSSQIIDLISEEQNNLSYPLDTFSINLENPTEFERNRQIGETEAQSVPSVPPEYHKCFGEVTHVWLEDEKYSTEEPKMELIQKQVHRDIDVLQDGVIGLLLHETEDIVSNESPHGLDEIVGLSLQEEAPATLEESNESILLETGEGFSTDNALQETTIMTEKQDIIYHEHPISGLDRYQKVIVSQLGNETGGMEETSGTNNFPMLVARQRSYTDPSHERGMKISTLHHDYKLHGSTQEVRIRSPTPPCVIRPVPVPFLDSLQTSVMEDIALRSTKSSSFEKDGSREAPLMARGGESEASTPGQTFYPTQIFNPMFLLGQSPEESGFYNEEELTINVGGSKKEDNISLPPKETRQQTVSQSGSQQFQLPQSSIVYSNTDEDSRRAGLPYEFSPLWVRPSRPRYDSDTTGHTKPRDPQVIRPTESFLVRRETIRHKKGKGVGPNQIRKRFSSAFTSQGPQLNPTEPIPSEPPKNLPPTKSLLRQQKISMDAEPPSNKSSLDKFIGRFEGIGRGKFTPMKGSPENRDRASYAVLIHHIKHPVLEKASSWPGKSLFTPPGDPASPIRELRSQKKLKGLRLVMVNCRHEALS
ncbi:uncharacterized protein O3C94_017618 [Discoglossus pictus]